MNDQDLLELTIDSLSCNGGRGVGRAQGLVVFVPGTAPGDRLLARVTARKPRFVEAEMVELLESSPQRRAPPCPVALRCGGCSWQHVTYAEQVEQKKQILAGSLRALKKLGAFEVLPFLAAPNEFHYRNRIQIQVREGRTGFFAKGTHDLVETRHCWIAEPSLNEKWKSLTVDDLNSARRVELALDVSGDVKLFNGDRDPETALFGQVNRAQNEVLKHLVVSRITGAPEWAMDLYAGSGNLTLPLVARVAPSPVLAVELSRESVARGRALKTQGVDWEAGDVAQVLGRLPVRSGSGCVVLDPPRPGCEREVLNQLVRHRPKQIVYVSCNPSTFARDAERLVGSGHYRVDSVQGLDMFPQTEHVELIAVLSLAAEAL